MQSVPSITMAGWQVPSGGESTNFKHFFPIGEVNGSHGVNRPGGSALNSGQVGGFRAAEYIAACYQESTLQKEEAENSILEAYLQAVKWMETSIKEPIRWQEALKDLQTRMSRSGAHIRSMNTLEGELAEAKQLVEQLMNLGCTYDGPGDVRNAFRVRQLAYAHWVYLDAIRFLLENQVGSRGSSIVLDPKGIKVHDQLSNTWKIQPEDAAYRSKILTTRTGKGGSIQHAWETVRPIPEMDSWFETTWAAFRKGEIYRNNQ